MSKVSVTFAVSLNWTWRNMETWRWGVASRCFLSNQCDGYYFSGSHRSLLRTHRWPTAASPTMANLNSRWCIFIIRIRTGRCRNNAKCIWKRFRREVTPCDASTFDLHSILSALENLPTSSILQQSMNEMQQLQGHHSVYSDPSSKFYRLSSQKDLHSSISSSDFNFAQSLHGFPTVGEQHQYFLPVTHHCFRSTERVDCTRQFSQRWCFTSGSTVTKFGTIRCPL